MHSLAVYVMEGHPFALNLSLENSADSYLCFRLALFHSVSYSFSLYLSPCLSLCTVSDSTLSNIDKVFLINTSANVFVFGGFNARRKDWSTYSGETDGPAELCYNFSQMTLLRWLTFLPRSLIETLVALLVLFLSSNANICSIKAFSPLGNSDHVAVSVSIDFLSKSQLDALFHCITYNYSD